MPGVRPVGSSRRTDVTRSTWDPAAPPAAVRVVAALAAAARPAAAPARSPRPPQGAVGPGRQRGRPPTARSSSCATSLVAYPGTTVTRRARTRRCEVRALQRHRASRSTVAGHQRGAPGERRLVDGVGDPVAVRRPRRPPSPSGSAAVGLESPPSARRSRPPSRRPRPPVAAGARRLGRPVRPAAGADRARPARLRASSLPRPPRTCRLIGLTEALRPGRLGAADLRLRRRHGHGARRRSRCR